MTANSIDFHEWKFGVRPEGLLVASISFGTKIGMAIGAAFVAYVLAWAGYDPKAVTEHASTAIAWTYLGAPSVLLVAQIVSISFYNMDALHPKIVEALKVKRNRENPGNPA